MNDIDFYNQTQEYILKESDSFSQSDTHKLGKIIQRHSELYYELEKPIISDVEYDILFKKLEFLEEKYDIDVKISQKAGSDGKQSSFKKVAHSRPMISLDNTYNAEELRDFDARIKKILHPLRSPSTSPLAKGEEKLPYTIEFKFDGLGIELIYKDGKLIQAITRGNGVEGEDVTQNIMQISNIPKTIDRPGVFEVRGEVVMPISSFERLNKRALEEGGKVFSNPRNAASGSLRVLDTSITKQRDLQYFAYDVSDFGALTLTLSQGEKEKTREKMQPLSPLGERIQDGGQNKEGNRYSDMIYYLESLGFAISSYFPKCQGIEEVISFIENIGDIKKQIDFEIDGLVVKINDISLWKSIGSTEHHPRYAISYKFPAEIVTTKLESVEHSVGRTGTITPVANLAPVNIGGAMIRRATLHNYDETQKLGVKIGDIVFLKRAGEVIPKIISVASPVLTQLSPNGRDESAILPPEYCPSCGEKVFKDEQKVRYYCANAYGCPAQMREKLAFTVGKQGFNIDGFGERQAELFYTLGFIKNFGDIFRLKNYREEILALDGFKEKSVNNLLEGIESVRKTDIVTFLKALGIPGVGKKTAKTLSNALTLTLSQGEKEKTREKMQPLSPLGERIQDGGLTMEDIFTSGFLNIESLQQLPDIGPEVAESVVDFFSTQDELVQDLLGELEISLPALTGFSSNRRDGAEKGKYTGKKMCITGSFEGYKRDELAEILEQQGGEFMSSVSAKTDYLLAGEKAGSKLKKANELGVEILSLEEFLSDS